MIQKYLRAATVLLLALALVATVLTAKEKSDKLYKEAQAAELKEDWDHALELYLQALDQKPNDALYLIGMRRARFESGAKHVKQGQKLRTDGKLKEAMAEFQKALIADPASSMAIQEIKRTQQMLNAASKQTSSTAGDRALTPSDLERKESEERIDSMLPPPELKPVLRTIDPLVMHNQPLKIIYETIGKLAGVNVLFDPQMAPSTHNFNLDLPRSTPDQAFDYLGVETHTFWKAISSNTIFVSEDNATKHRDFDDEVVKTVYVTNMTSIPEFQEIVSAVRALTEIRRTFSSNAQKAIIMRGTTDAVALAEKVIRDLDKPKAEVVIDVIVMQANTSRTRDLAASIAGGGGLTVPLAFSPTNPVTTTTGTTGTTTTTTGTTTSLTPTTTTTTPTTGTTGTTAVALNQLGHLSSSDFSVSLPGALLNMIMTDSKTKVLNKPTLRASDGMKVQLIIGQKIPYATGSFQPGVGTVGVSPLVSTQFQFLDVGVTVDITPQVHSTTEVTLHVEITVSSVLSYVTLGGGLSQPVVGQTKNTADIRLREGEVNILSGLSSDSDTKSYGGIPGLTDIPVLGHVLFGNDHTDKEVGQLMIALVPHIIRTPDYTPVNLRSIAAGNETTIKLSYAPRPEETQAAQPEASTPGASSPITVTGQPGAATPQNVPPVTASPANPQQPQPVATLPPGVTPAPPFPPGPPLPGAIGGALRGVTPAPGSPPSTPGSPPSTPGTPPSAPGALPAPPGTPPGTGGPRITFGPATLQAAPGNPVTVTVQVENANDVFSASPIHIKFDPAQLRLNDVVPGDLFTRDGVRATSQKDIRNDTGDATLTVARLPGTAGVSGSGAIVTLNFVAVGRGSSTIKVDAGLKNSKQQPIPIEPREISVRIQ
jgi:general secretion pathway protein D